MTAKRWLGGAGAIFQRELRAYFLSPTAYVVLCFLLLANGIAFARILTILNDPLASPGRPLDVFFMGVFPLVVIFVAPVLTMRLVAEERRSGAMEMLLAAPVTEGQIVAGKYLASLAFYVFLWVPTLAYAVIVAFYSEVDWGSVAGGYLGVFLVGALFLAVGLFASSLTANQIIAAVMSLAVILVYTFGVGFLEWSVNTPWLRELGAYLSFGTHMEELAKGIVDTRRLIFYASTTLFTLFLTSRAIESGRGR
jgi:ABC-2 type transport system permease protein